MRTQEKKSAMNGSKSFEYFDGELRIKKGTAKDKKKLKSLKNIKSFFQGGNLTENLKMLEELETE